MCGVAQSLMNFGNALGVVERRVLKFDSLRDEPPQKSTDL